MGLLRRGRSKGDPTENRRVSRTSLTEAAPSKKAAKAASNKRTPKNAKLRKSSGNRGRFGTAMRQVGAYFWPERFPEVVASRARREVEQGPMPRGFIWVWALALALASAGFIVHLNVRFEIINTGYALSQAQAEQRRMRLTQRELRLELATLKEPGRIEAQARTELGMERPDHERIIRLGGRNTRLARRGR
jgi:cell division protein FtsL